MMYSIDQMLEGIEEARQGNTLIGLQLLRDSVNVPDLPEAMAWHGYCLAREKRDFGSGISLCNKAKQNNPRSSDIRLALGRIYLLAGLRSAAVRTLETGLKLDKNLEISRLLNSIGIRKPPVFRFLNRDNRFNVASGRFFSRMGLR